MRNRSYEEKKEFEAWKKSEESANTRRETDPNLDGRGRA
jgi:hypothetical protein